MNVLMEQQISAIDRAHKDNLITEWQANMERQAWKAMSIYAMLFGGLRWEKGNPVAVCESEITPFMAEEVREWTASLDKDERRYLIIDSQGGSAVSGISVMNLLRREKQMTAVVHGQAFSAAGMLLQGAEDRVMLPGSFVGVHRSHVAYRGNAEEMRDVADKLDTIDNSMMELFSVGCKDKFNAEKLKELMRKDTLLSGEDAVALGLADRVEKVCPTVGMRMPSTLNDDEEEEKKPDEQPAAQAARREFLYEECEYV